MSILLVACGALARELIAMRDKHGWDAKILALPALLHNTPKQIPDAVVRKIEQHSADFERTIVVYGDCGSGGLLDKALDALNIERIAGPHCYEQYAGADHFTAMMTEEPGTFFLTDYLVQSFDHLVIEGLGIKRHPDLRDVYFANYKRVVYLQQRRDPVLVAKAESAARALALPLEVCFTGYGDLESRLLSLLQPSLQESNFARNHF